MVAEGGWGRWWSRGGGRGRAEENGGVLSGGEPWCNRRDSALAAIAFAAPARIAAPPSSHCHSISTRPPPRPAPPRRRSSLALSFVRSIALLSAAYDFGEFWVLLVSGIAHATVIIPRGANNFSGARHEIYQPFLAFHEAAISPNSTNLADQPRQANITVDLTAASPYT